MPQFPSQSSASDIWSLTDVSRAIQGQNWPVMTAFESIATTTVGAGGTSTITFSSIPNGYKHLQIRGIARADVSGSASQAQLQINGDTSLSSYAFHSIVSSGTAVASYGYPTGILPSMSPVLRGTGNTNTANAFGVTIFDILDYASTTKNKTVRTLTGYSSSATGEVQHNSGVWLSNSAVTSLTISWQDTSQKFMQYSQFALYGIKG